MRTVQEITSAQNPSVKRWVKLRESRSYREEEQRLLISGVTLVSELGRDHPLITLIALIDTPLPSQVQASQVVYVTAPLLKKITGLENPEPLAAEIAMPQPKKVLGLPFVLVLDGIADPGNLGTLLRTALGLGWDGVFLTTGCVDPFNDKALRAAKGATFRLPWQRGSVENLLKERSGRFLVADAAGGPVAIHTPPLTLILGNETHGPSPHFHSLPKVGIPMHPDMESLNVASAGAILMHQIKQVLS